MLFYTGIIVAIVLTNILAPYIAPYPPNTIDIRSKLLPPSSEHIMGTDNLGRDIFSRALYGGRSSLLIATVASFISMGIGLILGGLAGYFGGIIDAGVTVLTNIFQGLPGMVLMIAIVGIFGFGTHSLILAMVIPSWTGFSRFVRAEVLKTKEETYVEAFKCFGAGHTRILLRGIFPNIIGNCIVLFSTRVGRSVLSVAGLSYLGIGIQPPTPDWGAMIREAHTYFRTAPHLLIAPGLCILLFSVSVNLLGDTLKAYLDKRAHTGEVMR